jgi:hypothetical protein
MKIVKIIFAAVLMILPLTTIEAQVPVKQDLIKIMDAVPAPPLSSKDAFAKTGTADAEGNITCSAVKVFAGIDQQIKGFENTYTDQAKSDVLGMPAGMPGAGMTEADAERIQSMSKEQQIAMAMAMAGKMSQPVQLEPPAIKAAQQAWQELYAQIQQEHEREVKIQMQQGVLEERYRQEHCGLDSLLGVETSKLPQICYGEMSAPDPAQLKALRLKYADRHIALADKYLAEVTVRWKAEMERIKTRNGNFLKKLEACNYADGARNYSTKKILSDGQMQVMNAINTQVEISRHAWEESAGWQAKKKMIESEKS